MSYARFGWDGSDVYVFLHYQGFFTCCACSLQEREWIEEPSAILGGYLKPVGEIIETDFRTTAEMINHLDQHRAAGHCVPDSTYEDLIADTEENERYIARGGHESGS